MDHWIAFWTALWVGSEKITRWVVDWLCNAKPKLRAKPAREQPAEKPGDTGKAGEEPEADPGETPKPPKGKTTKKHPAKKTAEEAEGSALLRWFAVAALAVIAKATPHTTTIALVLTAAWVLTALVLGYAAPFPEKAPADDEKKPDEGPAADQRHPSEILTREHVALVLAEVYAEGSGVHLATLAKHLTRTPLVGLPATPWATRHVKALLTRHGVRVRDGVRVPPKGGREGVHREDFPPSPHPLLSPPLLALLSQVRATTTTRATPTRSPSPTTPTTPYATPSTTPKGPDPWHCKRRSASARSPRRTRRVSRTGPPRRPPSLHRSRPPTARCQTRAVPSGTSRRMLPPGPERPAPTPVGAGRTTSRWTRSEISVTLLPAAHVCPQSP